MKKLITLLFAAGLVTAVSAQQGGRRYDNSYQSSPYSYNDQYRNDDRYDRNSQWNDRGYHSQFDRDRRRIARERHEYEMMMMRRNQARYHQRSYGYYTPYRKPSLQIRIGIGGNRY